MSSIERQDRQITLAELSVAVVLVALLAAMSIPSFLELRLSARVSEATTNLAALTTAEEAYFVEYQMYVGRGIQSPSGAATPDTRPWPSTAPDFDTLGFSPEGDVYFVYAATVAGTAYSLGARGDLDGRGEPSDFGYIKIDPRGNDAGDPFGGGCVGGVFDPENPDRPLPGTVGPCGQHDGGNDF